MTQIARNVTDTHDGFLRDTRYQSMANSCLRSNWRVEETRTVGLPREVM